MSNTNTSLKTVPRDTYARHDGEMPWFWINPSLSFLSYKFQDQVGRTVPFLKNGLETAAETEERVREVIAGYDRHAVKVVAE